MREPTRYVMLTVNVSLLGSGNSSTRMPLPSAYSVMPSTLVTWRGAAAGGLAGGFAAGAGAAGRAGGAGTGAASAGAAARPAARAPTRSDASGLFTVELYRRAPPRWAGRF